MHKNKTGAIRTPRAEWGSASAKFEVRVQGEPTPLTCSPRPQLSASAQQVASHWHSHNQQSLQLSGDTPELIHRRTCHSICAAQAQNDSRWACNSLGSWPSCQGAASSSCKLFPVMNIVKNRVPSLRNNDLTKDQLSTASYLMCHIRSATRINPPFLTSAHAPLPIPSFRLLSCMHAIDERLRDIP